MWLDEKELDGCIKKGREVEAAIKKITNETRIKKLVLKKKYKKKAREDKEMMAVKSKYYESRKTLYEQREKLIQSIPGFWKTAFLSCPCLREHLSDQGAKIIEYLKSVDVDNGQNDNSEHVITFTFNKNQYFENSWLKKIYSCTSKGIFHKSGTKILWNTDTTVVSENETPGSIHSLTDDDKRHISLLYARRRKYFYADYAIFTLGILSEHNFFTRLFDPQDKDLSKKPRDEVLEAIEEHLWCYAPVHFLNGITAAVGGDEENKKKTALDAIKIIQDKLEDVRGEEYRKCIAVERKFEEKARVHQVDIEQKCIKEWRSLYQKRNEILKAIPNFWLFAFLSHPELGDLFREQDQKIFRFVNCMDVDDEEDVVSGYTITLNFNDNSYFTNSSLKKRIYFREDGTTDLSAVKIEWKDGMAITTEYLHDAPDFDAGFFTWFCAPQVIRKGYLDEVSELIKDDLWPNALEYFVNGNESDEEDKPPKRRREMTQLASAF